MRRKILAIIVIVLATLSIVEAFNPSNADYYVSSYNSRIDNAPSLLRDFVGDQRVELNVLQNDGSIYRIGFITQNARIVQTVPGGLNDSTVDINATASAIDQINGSGDPITTFQQQRDYGQITIEGKTTANRVRIAAVLSSASVLEFFYNIFYGSGS